MLEFKTDIEFEQYYNGVIINKDGSHLCMNKADVRKYIVLLEKCPIICDNLVFQMSLKKRDDKIDFNGLVAYQNKDGGFSTYGTIDTGKEVINYNISFKNDDKYENFKITYDEINKGKVK